MIHIIILVCIVDTPVTRRTQGGKKNLELTTQNIKNALKKSKTNNDKISILINLLNCGTCLQN